MMLSMRLCFALISGLGLLVSSAAIAAAEASGDSAVQEVPAFSLAAEAQAPDAATGTERSETVASETGGPRETEWDIWAPIRMRSANPQDLGTVQVLQSVDYSTSSDGTDDDVRTKIDIQYGFAKDHQLSLAVPMLLGDGQAEGNTNLEAGWQWRLWEEKDALPAFALLNELYIPAGYHAAGVDWRLTGLFTKSITDQWRLHLNPFLTVASGDSPQPRELKHPGDLRDFQWGLVVGTDYRVTEDFTLNLDYIHETSEYKGNRNQHTMEAGFMWAISPRHGFGMATRWTLDGDGVNDNWGATFSYSYTFSAPSIGG